MEMADTIVINKADGDNIRKAQLAKSEFNRALHLAKQSQAGFLQLQLGAITQDGIQSLGNHHEIYRTHEAMIILMKNAWNRTNIGCSRLSTNN
jgi:LAO/AO transport system kinase